MSEFITNLEVRLRGLLPGTEVQEQMAARKTSKVGIVFKHKGPPKKGGVTILLYRKQQKWHLPLMKRPSYQGVHSGQISFPGGKMESHDSDLIDTALRETAEELGVTVSRKQVIGSLSPLYIMASHFEVLPVVAVITQPPIFDIDPREVQDLIEVELDHLLDPKNKKETEIRIKGTEINAPYFDVQQEVVWGATAMMLNEFLTIVKELNN